MIDAPSSVFDTTIAELPSYGVSLDQQLLEGTSGRNQVFFNDTLLVDSRGEMKNLLDVRSPGENIGHNSVRTGEPASDGPFDPEAAMKRVFGEKKFKRLKENLGPAFERLIRQGNLSNHS